ncbi:hypothetical protein [Cytophaga sp. FL35]|uniref:CBU_0592 family membrane protein n=1 Tax=Cytophaga sp. FL35 TaxID=1904456 RepID=UPI001653A5EB|nr:hypothetical protein [Cytophaga sp. FL35]MBC7000545.1 hypothetical protein [Cytophaga sp. FL35]
MELKYFLDVFGWSGSIMVLVSYALTLNKTKDFSKLCSYLNLLGGFLIAINCLYYNAMPSFVTNIIWTCIAVISIYRTRKHMESTEFRKRKRSKNMRNSVS